MGCVELFQQQQLSDIAEEVCVLVCSHIALLICLYYNHVLFSIQEQRDARERIIKEQEEAYAESLQADRAKSLVRQAEEEAQRKVEKQELEERIRLEDEKRQEEKEKAVSVGVAISVEQSSEFAP